ncbi:MAG: VCBS repeat-containing protein [Anaerolineales bacterium]|nr:VCBS repeat-containing protein [Anaerolineales bacterium]
MRPAVPILEQALREKLAERFDVRAAGISAATPDERRRKARSLGASYTLHGTLFRIGKGVTLDMVLAPTEDPGKGRTIVVSGTLDDATALSLEYTAVFRNLGGEAARKLGLLFFGNDRLQDGTGVKSVPGLTGTVSRSAPLPGEVVSVAMSDVDRDGKMELVAAFPSEIMVYRLDGDELREKSRIPNAGPGLIHLDARDVDRDGTAEILAVRHHRGKVLSDIWQFDGKEYRKTASDLPYFLRTADLGPEGIVLLAQEGDPRNVYRGPIFRLPANRPGAVDVKERGRPLPLPDGVFIYSFTPLRTEKEVRYAALTGRDRLIYLDSTGRKLWEGLDAVTGAKSILGDDGGKPYVSARMAAVDLGGDGNDELVLLNDLVAAGTFFENIRVSTKAELLCFAQAGDALQLAWRSSQADASARDLLVERMNRGVRRFGMVSRDRGKILGGASRWQILWMK